MTHTAEPMTLEQVRDGLRAMKTFPHSMLSKWADAIDAELAKQREAEPVAWIEVRAVIEDTHHPQGKSAEVFATDACMNLDVGDYDLYTHPQQRNAAEVSNRESVRQLLLKPIDQIGLARGRIDEIRFHEDEGGLANEDDLRQLDEILSAGIDKIISLEKAFIDALSAAASRDREDAERYRWLREHGNRFFNAVTYQGTGDIFDASVDAARRENKA